MAPILLRRAGGPNLVKHPTFAASPLGRLAQTRIDTVEAPMKRLSQSTGMIMSSFKTPDLKQRQLSAVAAKQALLEKFRSASDDPMAAERAAERAAIAKARAIREEERAAAKEVRRKEMAEEARLAAERAEALKREAEAADAMLAAQAAEKQLALLAEQKAARDARYAARKVAKKERRKG